MTLEQLEALKREVRTYFNTFTPGYEALLHRHGDAVIDHLAATGRLLPEWQPMETAPKHEYILMLMKHGAIEGVWDGETGYGYYWTDLQWYPTHWMPLPQPPAAKKG